MRDSIKKAIAETGQDMVDAGLPSSFSKKELEPLGVKVPDIRFAQDQVRAMGGGGMLMNISEHIEINPEVMLGKPVIRGTRIPVELILRKLGEGITEHDLLDAYPRLTVENIRAAIMYAAETIAFEDLIIPAEYQHPGEYAENTIPC